MTTNTDVEIWIKEQKWKIWLNDSWVHIEYIDTEEDEEYLSACCGAVYIGETTLCSDCREYG